MDVIGNVKHQTIKPPEEEELPTSPGHLIFDADFESGNLGKVEYCGNNEYDLYIRVDTCNQKYRLWFHYSVTNAKVGQTCIFHIVNFSKGRSLYREGMGPVVRSTSRVNWTRLSQSQCYYWKGESGGYILSFTFKFDVDERYEFAYCFPYDYARMQTRQGILGWPLLSKLVLLTIGSGERHIVVMARVHPGESPASFIMDGFLDFITSEECNIAKYLRDQVTFKIIPMLNPDGVALGNYRCSLMGFDLNRHWRDTNPWAQPGLHAVKAFLIGLEKEHPVDFCFDIHAHSLATGAFMYGNVVSEDQQSEQQAFPKIFSAFAEDFSLSKTNFNKDAVKSGTARRVLGGLFPKSYTLEVSFYNYQKDLRSVPYTQKAYCELGENLARAIAEYYRKYPTL